MKAGSELGSLGSRASSQFWGLLASLSSPTPILTVLTSNTLQPMWTTDPVRTDFSLPWNAPSPFLSLCFHTAPKVPSLPFSAYPNPTYSAKSNQVPPLPAGFPGCLRFYFIHLVLYQSESAYNKLGLNFISFLFPQYIYPFNKKIFKTQKIPLKDWILVLRLSVQLWQDSHEAYLWGRGTKMTINKQNISSPGKSISNRQRTRMSGAYLKNRKTDWLGRGGGA